MSNLKVALALAAQGWSVFPCRNVPGDKDHKKPHAGVWWRSQSTTDRHKIEAWWRLWPDALPGLDCGKSGFLVIDLDFHDPAANGLAAWDGLAAGRDPTCPTVDTPSGGRHLYFRQPAKPLGNRKGALPAGIDVRGAGGYVIAGGAKCLDGTAYRLSGDMAQAPTLPDWLAEIIKADRAETKPAPPAARPQPRSLQASDIDRMREALSHIPADDRDLWVRVGMAIKSELGEAGFAEWRTWSMSSAKWREKDGQKIWRSLKSDGGITIGTLFGIAQDHGWREAPEQDPALDALGAELAASLIKAKELEQAGPSLVETEHGDIVDDRTGEIIRNAKPPTARKSAGLPERLTRVPGLVGEIADWIYFTSRRPSWTMSLAAALVVVGTAIGRDRAGPTASATHLYTLMLAPTGAGKQHPLDQVGRLLTSAGMSTLIGPSDYKSGAAVTKAIVRSPLMLCCMDEFGALMRRINDPRGNTHAQAVTQMFRTLWGKSFAPHVSDEGAQQQAQTIQAPAMSVLGASTEHEFYSSVGSKEVADDFLNRFLILLEPERAPERDPAMSPHHVPELIAGKLGRLFNPGNGNLASSAKQMTQAIIKPRPVPWADAAAKAIYDDMGSRIFAIGDADAEREPYYARSKEMAVRLATIVACGIDHEHPVVTADVMSWARDLAMHSARTMMEGVSAHASETKIQALAQEVLRIVAAAGGVIGHAELGRRLKNKYSRRDRQDVLTMLVEDELLAVVEFRPAKGSKGGRPSRAYRLMQTSANMAA